MEYFFEGKLTQVSDKNNFVIDDRSTKSFVSTFGSVWRLVTDDVMGGVSFGELSLQNVEGIECIRMSGNVSTENNGGFVQMSLDLTQNGPFDATSYDGVEAYVLGNNERYNIHLKTVDLFHPWQSYRFTFLTNSKWQKIRIPFSELEPHRTDIKFRKDGIKRIAFAAIGREFDVEIYLASIRFYSLLEDGKDSFVNE